MINLRSSGALSSAGVLSALAASLCCITPVVALLAGSSSVAANFSWIEPARPYLIGLSIAILAFAWYVQLKPAKSNNMDCNCETKKSSFLQSNTFLFIITVFSVLMISFPLYARIFNPEPKVQPLAVVTEDNRKQVKFSIHGMTCAGCEIEVNNQLSKVNGILSYKTSYAGKSSFVTYDATKVDLKTIEAAIAKTGYTLKGYEMIENKATASDITFYEAPLVCAAAPSIGCGSKAKFMLVDIEKNKEAVEGAWLNKEGTVVAVKWKPRIAEDKKATIISSVSNSHNIELTTVLSIEANNYAKTFPNSSQWFKSKEVDKLSKEEAQIIAKNTIEGYKKDGLIKASFEKQFQADIARIYENLFLSISSYKDLTTEAYNKVEGQIQKAGEKYVGKGNMPRVELCVASEEKCEKDKSCSKDGKSCCEKD